MQFYDFISDETTETSEKFEFPKLDREVNYTNQDEVFEIFEVQNQTELQEEIARRRKALQTHIKGTIFKTFNRTINYTTVCQVELTHESWAMRSLRAK